MARRAGEARSRSSKCPLVGEAIKGGKGPDPDLQDRSFLPGRAHEASREMGWDGTLIARWVGYGSEKRARFDLLRRRGTVEGLSRALEGPLSLVLMYKMESLLGARSTARPGPMQQSQHDGTATGKMIGEQSLDFMQLESNGGPTSREREWRHTSSLLWLFDTFNPVERRRNVRFC